MTTNNKVIETMEMIKGMTVEELINFTKEFDLYRENIVKALGGNLNVKETKDNNDTTKETKEEKKVSKKSNGKTHKELLSVDKDNAFMEGIKAGDELVCEDSILTCATTKCNTVVGGQCVVNNTVCNYSYYVQFGKAIVYSDSITKEQLDNIADMVTYNIPKGVRVFDAVPSNHPDSPTFKNRWYYDELEEGNFIFSNPDGSYFGYTNGYAFIIRDSGFMEATRINYVFGKSWRKPNADLTQEILDLKVRAFGEDNTPDETKKITKKNNKKSTKEDKNTKGYHNRNTLIVSQYHQDEIVEKQLNDKDKHEASQMQEDDLSFLED